MESEYFFSKSENRGLELISRDDLQIYSVGISTAGIAEIRMAKSQPKRKIIASTIDVDGAAYSKDLILSHGVENQVIIKVEDVREKLPYESKSFDFVYARLVLHYLAKPELEKALHELFRILKPSGKLFVVDRGKDPYLMSSKNIQYDENTALTTIISERGTYCRYFHTESTIRNHLENAHFQIQSLHSFEETLCYDYQRKKPATAPSLLLEVFATKMN